MSTPRFRKRLRLGSATWWQCRTRSERSAGQYSASVLGEEPVASQLLDGDVPHICVDRQREAAKACAAPLCQVHDGFILELSAGGEVQLLKGRTAVSEAAQRQPIYPVTVRERKALQAGAALGQRPQRAAAQLPAAGQRHTPQLGIPRQHRHQILVRQPFVTRRQRQLLQPLGVPQQPGQCGLRDLRTHLRAGKHLDSQLVTGADAAYPSLRSAFLAAGRPRGLPPDLPRETLRAL
ncbi:hypothetical protein DBR06_SOUSAS110188 [Sousa chinensis]|uniref:Uncharacterized protein n=1 Tax=Sousa chinensis TaxID=103600 RepID=A0A484GRJ5_SOUCH|nr:hypothetical protein DBR06_SOUSAS110188 [Sousa chinensis]